MWMTDSRLPSNKTTRTYLEPLFQHVRDLLAESAQVYGRIQLFPVTTTEMRGTITEEYTAFRDGISNYIGGNGVFQLKDWVTKGGELAHRPPSHSRTNADFERIPAQCECP